MARKSNSENEKKTEKKNPWEAPLTVSGSPFRSRQTKVQRSLFWFFLFFFFLLDRKRRNFLFFFYRGDEFSRPVGRDPIDWFGCSFLGFFFWMLTGLDEEKSRSPLDDDDGGDEIN